ncbi:mitochondrial ribonuclease P protein 1 homolog [Euwallacea fornicatus]|uniref:mitochondrial ribonuclease P protein 1 homolog n=1 Tax=Euwallacea fornicatus TaxID=995702 RepID=UPI00338E2D52
MFVRKRLVMFPWSARNILKNVSTNSRYQIKQNNIQCFSFLRNNSSQPGFSNQDDTTEIKMCTKSSVDSENTNSLPENLESITKGDKELEHKLKVIMLEVEVLRQSGKPVPDNDFITLEMWEYLLSLSSRSGRTKYLEFLFKVTKKKQRDLEKKLEKRKEVEEFMSRKEPAVALPVEEHAFKYALQYNNIFTRFRDTTINRFYNRKLVEAMQFGQKLVVDCGYEKNMTKRENYNTGKQLMLLFSENRAHDEPFDIHFTGLNLSGDITKSLEKNIPTVFEKDFPINIHENSYLDLFSKERLIYLTPHCREEMRTFNHDMIYILGGIVDKVNNEPISLAKAKREGLTMMKFPLDRYLQWGSGSGKSLTINQCVAILLDLKKTGDWNYALKHVPRRKLIDPSSDNKSKLLFDYKPQRRIVPERRTNWRPGNSSKSLGGKVKSFYDE